MRVLFQVSDVSGTRKPKPDLNPKRLLKPEIPTGFTFTKLPIFFVGFLEIKLFSGNQRGYCRGKLLQNGPHFLVVKIFFGSEGVQRIFFTLFNSKLKPKANPKPDICYLYPKNFCLPDTSLLSGLVRLVRTYQVNLTVLSDHGLVQYQGTTTNQKSFNSYERLSAIDFIALAIKARKFKMFDVAIEFSREILRLIPNETGSIMVPDIIRQSFDKFKNDLVTLNNRYLIKTKMFEGNKIQKFVLP